MYIIYIYIYIHILICVYDIIIIIIIICIPRGAHAARGAAGGAGAHQAGKQHICICHESKKVS